jgi:hypothetical protein
MRRRFKGLRDWNTLLRQERKARIDPDVLMRLEWLNMIWGEWNGPFFWDWQKQHVRDLRIPRGWMPYWPFVKGNSIHFVRDRAPWVDPG